MCQETSAPPSDWSSCCLAPVSLPPVKSQALENRALLPPCPKPHSCGRVQGSNIVVHQTAHLFIANIPALSLTQKRCNLRCKFSPKSSIQWGGVLWQDVTPSRCLRSRPVAFQGWWLCSGQLCKCWIISWSSCGSQAVSLAPSMSVLHVCTQRLQLDKGSSCLPQAFEFVTTLQHRVPCLKVQTYFLANRCWPLCSSHVRAGPAETEPFEETKNHISSAASGAPHMAKLQPWGPLAQNLRCFMGRSWCHVGWPPGRGWLIHPGPQLPVAVPTHLVVKESPVAPRAMAMVAPGSCLKLHLRLFSACTEASLQAVLSRLLAE